MQNLDAKILPAKGIVATLDVPSERYSRQVQKSTRVVLQNARIGSKRTIVFGVLVHNGESHIRQDSTIISETGLLRLKSQ